MDVYGQMISVIDRMPSDNEIYSDDNHFFLFDDMAYSGLQLYGNAGSTRNKNVYIVVPYITDIAKKLLKNFELIGHNRTDIIPCLKTALETWSIELDITQGFQGFQGFQYQPNITAIYFDHKIADSLSTLQKFYMYGTYPIGKKTQCILTSMVKGCPIPDTQYLNEKYYPSLCQRNVDDLNEYQNACPKTFYKSIEWTFRYEKLDKTKTILQIFKSV